MKEELHEIKEGEQKNIFYEQTKGVLHGCKFEINFHPHSFLFQIYFKSILIFEFSEDVPFQNIYYKSIIKNDYMVVHVIFDNDTILYEELDYLEFYFLVFENEVYFVERKVSEEYKSQIFVYNLGKEYEYLSETIVPYDFECLFENNFYINLFKDNQLDKFPILETALEQFVFKVLKMKKFSY